MTVEEPHQRGRLRPVERADLLAVVRIEEQTFERAWTLSTFERFLDAPAFLVLEDPEAEGLGDGIAGYIVAEVVRVRGRQIGHVKDLAVKPACQGEGRGRRLLDGALRLLGSHGANSVRLEVRPSNSRALSLYQTAGFEIVARQDHYYPDGEDALILARALEGDLRSRQF